MTALLALPVLLPLFGAAMSIVVGLLLMVFEGLGERLRSDAGDDGRTS